MLWHLFSDSVLNVKTLVGTSNQEKAIAGAFSVIIQLQASRRFVSSSILLPTYLLGLRGGRFPALGQHPLGGLGPHQPLEVDAAAALGRDAQTREGNQEGRLPLLRNWRGHGGLASKQMII